ncbi:MAG: phosphoadenylyl-sulfate reductase [Pseudomonadota bacterium]
MTGLPLDAARDLEDLARGTLENAVRRWFPGRIALVSSFGAEAAVLLHMASRIDRDLPVLFVDTGRLFRETLDYRDRLALRLGLRNLRTVQPPAAAVAAADPARTLWGDDPDRCCSVRKVAPLREALAPFAAWITGRKRAHGQARISLEDIEVDGAHLKLNPLAAWSAEDVAAYYARYELPEHPLVRDGYASIGCAPCTAKTVDGDDPRSGRWVGVTKTECGIHWPADGGPPQRVRA